MCYSDTRERSRAMSPPPRSVKMEDLPRIDPVHLDGTRPPLLHGSQPDRVPVPMPCRVENTDALECGVSYLRKGHHPVVLNLADDLWPGGCVENGSGAQEESLFRCTNLCATLSLTARPRLYPILDTQLIYSPGVKVLKSSEATGWRLLEPPHDRLAIISCPGLRWPCLAPGGRRLQPQDVARLEHKVRLIMRCAFIKSHDVVVLGALGCGAWRNPAPHVAQVFYNVLQEPEFAGQFAQVVFAVLKPVKDMYIIQPRSPVLDRAPADRVAGAGAGADSGAGAGADASNHDVFACMFNAKMPIRE